MKLNIRISDSIIKRITGLTNICSGNLYGILNKNDLVIVALQTAQTNFDLGDCLPVGIEKCGLFKVRDENVVASLSETKTLLLSYAIGNKDSLTIYTEQNGTYKVNNYSVVTENEVNADFFYLRVKGDIPLKSELTDVAIKEAFQLIQKATAEIVFSFLKSKVFLLRNQTIGIDNNMTLTEFCIETNSFSDDVNRKKKNIPVKPRILEFKILEQLTNSNSCNDFKDHAPIGILDKVPLKVIDTCLQLDSLAIIKSDVKITNIYSLLQESVRKILKLFENNFQKIIEINSSRSIVYQVCHFYPEECQHFLTVLYAKHQSEKDLRSYRMDLHKSLLLNELAPCFRRANSYSFDRKSNGPLINPHEGIKATENGGVIAIVKGKYEYYHYCQNKMDDNGWGCAYRSLQTLASWFKLQGYVNREVPTFNEIQQCLVDIKDKPANFVGSRQWIGSTEVNFVLNTLLGVDNKILYVSSGEDMASKGPELVNHFQNYGSPIMIGGGVLAHTILGVDYNQETGDIKFLILDPHYTGGEDLYTIQSKGWCGWKNVDFWDKASYYNMCLPLAPRDV